ncbi:serine/threonine-protein kinase [Rhizohabitans arisaemae]|uniref:serine/threonine-protein kinase n=1 Tax=Rhizohabitans arisaemae TaxID=2720610 RepID=UPI0024B07AA9|nr:serine/threonine-protein kinase [Rhizohabitans arisaemae]
MSAYRSPSGRTPYPPERPPRGSRLAKIWALAPLLTLGFATPLVIGYAAARLGSRRLGLAAAGYTTLFFLYLSMVDYLTKAGTDSWQNNTAATIWFIVEWLGGTVHAFRLRRAVFPVPRFDHVPPVSSYGNAAPSPPRDRHPSATPPAQTPWNTGSHPTSRRVPAETSWNTGGGPVPPSTSIPRQIGPYVLTRKLGEGGQGTVYLGQAPDGQPVAVKLLHQRINDVAAERDGFIREVAAARRVPPFSTARIIDVDVVGDRAYIVSEYVHGPSLERLVLEERPRDGAGLTRLAIATSAALSGIHSAGVVHRDFKPANVLIGPDGPRVIDFGVAKALDRVTMTSGHAKGTPAYMSPEQVAGGPVGSESDVFSWASTMLFAATGRSPFEAPTLYQVLKLITEHRPDLSALPGPLRAPVAGCLDPDPRNRPTAAELMVALAR